MDHAFSLKPLVVALACDALMNLCILGIPIDRDIGEPWAFALIVCLVAVTYLEALIAFYRVSWGRWTILAIAVFILSILAGIWVVYSLWSCILNIDHADTVCRVTIGALLISLITGLIRWAIVIDYRHLCLLKGDTRD